MEEYGEHTVNIFNIYPETIPGWLIDWIPETGGYFAGNIGPGLMDYRYFAHGNLMAIVSGLATEQQAQAFMSRPIQARCLLFLSRCLAPD